MAGLPESFDRGPDGLAFDPDEPLVVPWFDVVAAIDVVVALKTVLTTLTEVDLDETRLQVGQQVRQSLTWALDDQPDVKRLETNEEAVEWLTTLARRLRGYLP